MKKKTNYVVLDIVSIQIQLTRAWKVS